LDVKTTMWGVLKGVSERPEKYTGGGEAKGIGDLEDHPKYNRPRGPEDRARGRK